MLLIQSVKQIINEIEIQLLMLEIKTHPYNIHTIKSKILVESEIVIDRDRE